MRRVAPATTLTGATSSKSGGLPSPAALCSKHLQFTNARKRLRARLLSLTQQLPSRVVQPSRWVICTATRHPHNEADGSTSLDRWLKMPLAAAALALALGMGLHAGPLAVIQPPAAAAAGAGGAAVLESSLEMKAPPGVDIEQLGLTREELNNIRIFQENTPSVVNITNIRLVQTGTWNLDVEKLPAGLGSGFFWDTNGHVVTNFHVIKGASEVRVTLLDQSSYTAKVVGADPDKDVAVLQVEMPPQKVKELRPVSLGTSVNLLVGQKVYAIGNPFGLDHTLTQGIISGLGRELDTGISSIKNVIQTDAAINPGNSGGILLDSHGQVIGINTAIADPTGKGSSSGVGFAIPIDTVKGLVDQILAYGKVSRPALGITVAPPQIIRQLGEEGVLVLEVPRGSPAYKAGLEGTYRDESGQLVLGDIIVAMDGKPVRDYKDLFGVLDEKKVNDQLQVEVLRGGKRIKLEVILGERILGQTE